MEYKDEADRIKNVYETRKERVPADLYSFFNPANLFIVQGRDRAMLEAFTKNGIRQLENKKILDIGCGRGNELRNLVRYGAAPENLYGFDLLPDRIEAARALSPNIDFRCGNAVALPYEHESFDLVMQMTVFTSILEGNMKQQVAAEMIRVLKPNGIILWYDYHMNNPKNPDVRGVRKEEIYRLFPDCDIYLRRITLAPPLARAIAPYSWLLCHILEKLPLLRTHYLGIIKKQ